MGGQVVVITGGSRGIGRAAAELFARRDDALVLAARDGTALEATAAALRARGAQVVTVPGDLRAPGAAERLVQAAVMQFGRIDVWVGAAGVLAYGGVEEVPGEVFRRVVDTNLFAQVDAVRAVLPQFRRQGRGRIVLIGSLYSRVTSPWMSAYVASKFALRGFARALRQELIGSRIDVSIILPATIDTAIYQRATNLTGRAPHPLPPVTSPYRVGRAIVRAARGRGPHTRHVGATQTAMVALSAAAPALYDGVMRILMTTLGLRERTPDTLGVLEQPQHDAGAVAGGWRSPARRVGLLLTAATAGAVWLARRPRR